MRHLRLAAAAFAAVVTLAAAPVHAAQVAPVGDDGLHKPTWLQSTFLDLRDDLADANSQNKRLMIIIEQRGCIYCKKMYEDVFPVPEIDQIIRDSYYVIQLNLWGDREVTDFDGKVLPEKAMIQRWHVVFTPTMIFLPEKVPEGKTAAEAAVMVMPGAFGKNTTLAMFRYIRDHIYISGKNFQKYFAENFQVDKKD